MEAMQYGPTNLVIVVLTKLIWILKNMLSRAFSILSTAARFRLGVFKKTEM